MTTSASYSGKRHLVVFDFDFSMIDDDSDHHVPRQLSPALFAQFDELLKTHQWTDLMVGAWSIGISLVV